MVGGGTLITGSRLSVVGPPTKCREHMYVSFLITARVKPSHLHALDHRSTFARCAVSEIECKPHFSSNPCQHNGNHFYRLHNSSASSLHVRRLNLNYKAKIKKIYIYTENKPAQEVYKHLSKWWCLSTRPQWWCLSTQPQWWCLSTWPQWRCLSTRPQWWCLSTQPQWWCLSTWPQWRCLSTWPQWWCLSTRPQWRCLSTWPQGGVCLHGHNGGVCLHGHNGGVCLHGHSGGVCLHGHNGGVCLHGHNGGVCLHGHNAFPPESNRGGYK